MTVPMEQAETLTDQEREVVLLLARGLSREAAAGRLEISSTKVARVLKSVWAKTGASNTVQAVAVLVQRGQLKDLRTDVLSTVPPPGREAGPACQALHQKMMSELDWQRFQELRVAYRVCAELGL